jgi:hypothetical protein
MRILEAQEQLQYIPQTPEFIKSRFNYWNSKVFNSEIPDDTVLSFARLPRRTTGTTRVNFDIPAGMGEKKLQRISGYEKLVKLIPPIVIKINNSTRLKPETFDGILIHEMIHANLYSKGFVFHGHEEMFMKALKEAESKAGMKIPIGHGLDEKVEDWYFPDANEYKSKLVRILIISGKIEKKRMFIIFSMSMEIEPLVSLTVSLDKSGRFSSVSLYEHYTPLASMFPVKRSVSGKSFDSYILDDSKEGPLDDVVSRGRLIYPVS